MTMTMRFSKSKCGQNGMTDKCDKLLIFVHEVRNDTLKFIAKMESNLVV
jgi:hypothetical protein